MDSDSFLSIVDYSQKLTGIAKCLALKEKVIVQGTVVFDKGLYYSSLSETAAMQIINTKQFNGKTFFELYQEIVELTKCVTRAVVDYQIQLTDKTDKTYYGSAIVAIPSIRDAIDLWCQYCPQCAKSYFVSDTGEQHGFESYLRKLGQQSVDLMDCPDGRKLLYKYGYGMETKPVSSNTSMQSNSGCLGIIAIVIASFCTFFKTIF